MNEVIPIPEFLIAGEPAWKYDSAAKDRAFSSLLIDRDGFHKFYEVSFAAGDKAIWRMGVVLTKNASRRFCSLLAQSRSMQLIRQGLCLAALTIH